MGGLTKEVRAVEGISKGVDHREAIQNVIRRSGDQKREFFFGVCSEPGQITTGHFRPEAPIGFMQILETSEGYSSSPLESCEWWHIP